MSNTMNVTVARKARNLKVSGSWS